jgi:hypothetical protein
MVQGSKMFEFNIHDYGTCLYCMYKADVNAARKEERDSGKLITVGRSPVSQ